MPGLVIRIGLHQSRDRGGTADLIRIGANSDESRSACRLLAQPFRGGASDWFPSLPIVALDEALAPNKVLAHPDLVRKFAAGEEFRPIHMRIGIMGACNMRCNFCNFHSPNEENFYDLFSFKDSIPTDKAVRLMQEFAATGGRAVTFCGSGECTIHPGYSKICAAAHEAGLRIGLITNGSRLSNPAVADCIAATHTWVRIGLNAGTAANFRDITRHRDGTFATFETTPPSPRISLRNRADAPGSAAGMPT